jgi:hypothetical protein
MQKTKPPSRGFILTVVVLVFLFVLFMYIEKEYLNPAEPPPTDDVSPFVPEQFPAHGTIIVADHLDCIAGLKITTPDNDSYYYVHMKDIADPQKTVKLFLLGGHTHEIKVPLGDYEFYYGIGNTWYGMDNLFGYNATYQKSLEAVTFNADDEGIYGWHISLFKTPDGDFRTTPVMPSAITG